MPSEVELLEVFRLAEAAGLDGIATAASARLVWSWLGMSRFHDTRDLTRRTLAVQPFPHPDTLQAAGRAAQSLGEPDQALGYFTQALAILRQVGDRAGEAVTRYNIAMIQRARGNLVEAVAELEQVVELDRQVQHPDLESDTRMLQQIREELRLMNPDAAVQSP